MRLLRVKREKDRILSESSFQASLDLDGLPWWPRWKESACNVGDLRSVPGVEGPLEKGMATHSSILVWRIPWTEGPGELQSMGSQRVRHDQVTNNLLSTQGHGFPTVRDAALERVSTVRVFFADARSVMETRFIRKPLYVKFILKKRYSTSRKG